MLLHLTLALSNLLYPFTVAPPRTRASAFLEKQCTELEASKTLLERQNNPSHAKTIGHIAMKINETKIMMEVADLEAALASGDLDDKATKARQRQLDEKEEKLRQHREKMEKAQNRPVVDEKK